MMLARLLIAWRSWLQQRPTPAWLYLVPIVVALIIAVAMYEGAIARAQSWGGLVKSVFDLYLPALAKQLGYRLPEKGDDRQRFWDAVNSMFLYLEPIVLEEWPQAEPDQKGLAEGVTTPSGKDTEKKTRKGKKPQRRKVRPRDRPRAPTEMWHAMGGAINIVASPKLVRSLRVQKGVFGTQMRRGFPSGSRLTHAARRDLAEEGNGISN
jgi:hypothetical protein